MICERISIQTENSAQNTHLDTYILEDFLDGDPQWKRPLVLICPGGAYARTSNREAEPVALQFTAMGYHAAVLRYSCAPAVYPTALHEVALSVKYLRDRAQQWHIDPEKILVMGFQQEDISQPAMGFSGRKNIWPKQQDALQKNCGLRG